MKPDTGYHAYADPFEAQAYHCVTMLECALDLASVVTAAGPWVLCYRAMHYRIVDAAYTAAIAAADEACTVFALRQDRDGYARACAEAAIAQYHLGQYDHARFRLAACAPPTCAISRAALAFAAFLCAIGQGQLVESIAYAEHGLAVLATEQAAGAAPWRMVLHRNLAAAYHFAGDLCAARQAMATALALAEAGAPTSYHLYWTLYEAGVLEQRAGACAAALQLLRRARALTEQEHVHTPLWHWIVCAEGQVLRDMGALDAAAACYARGGWGEGDDGPLLLWWLQGRISDVRIAAEARLVAAHASGSTFELCNLQVILLLIDADVTHSDATCHHLLAIAQSYQEAGFRYHHASVLLHVAALCYARGDLQQGDQLLADAFAFGAATGYDNFAWWHPTRMHVLLRRALKIGIEPDYARSLCCRRGLHTSDHTLALTCFGAFQCRLDGQLLPDPQWRSHGAAPRRMQRMLVFLAQHRAPQSLHAIARYVWADAHAALDPLNNFHVTLSALRRVLEPRLQHGCDSQWILTTPHGYQLAPEITVLTDCDQIMQHLASGRAAQEQGDRAAACQQFVAIEHPCSGAFVFANVDPAEAAAYQRVLYAALEWLATDDLARHAYVESLARAQRLLHDDSWNTAAPALLIRAFLALGNRRAARRQYARLLRDHGTPSPEIQALARAHRL